MSRLRVLYDDFWPSCINFTAGPKVAFSVRSSETSHFVENHSTLLQQKLFCGFRVRKNQRSGFVETRLPRVTFQGPKKTKSASRNPQVLDGNLISSAIRKVVFSWNMPILTRNLIRAYRYETLLLPVVILVIKKGLISRKYTFLLYSILQ